MVLFMATGLGGCRIAYLFHAATGQIKLLAGAEDIAKAAGSLNEEQAERVELIRQVKAFAERELGIKQTENYSTIYPRPLENPIWALSAAPRDRLTLKTWWFPVVGNMPYLGFFEKARADERAEKLESEGYDVVVRRASAYSTLGWFRDPITMNMLRYQPAVLAEVIIHELTHATVYVKGQAAFNEGLAEFMGIMGAVRYFEALRGPDDPQTKLAAGVAHDEAIFSMFLDLLLGRLEAVYDSSLPYEEKMRKRDEVYAQGLEELRRSESEFKTDLYRNFGQGPVNNARLLSAGLYHRNFGLFHEVYLRKDRDLKSFLLFFRDFVEDGRGNMLDNVRKWLAGQKREAFPRKQGIPDGAIAFAATADRTEHGMNRSVGKEQASWRW